MPDRAKPSSSPIALRSLYATTAVGSPSPAGPQPRHHRPAASSRPATREPVGGRAGAWPCGTRGAGGDIGCAPVDERDVVVAQPDQVIDGLPDAHVVGGADHIDSRSGRPASHDDHRQLPAQRGEP